MTIWKNKKDWAGHDCCLALTDKEVVALAEALSREEEPCDIVVMIRDCLNGYLQSIEKGVLL